MTKKNMQALLDDLPPLREEIAAYGLMAKKSMGQHFLLDLNLTKRIVSLAGDLSGCTVFEIGPGPGGLTRALMASDAKYVVAIEKDNRCLEILSHLQAISPGRLKTIFTDALEARLIDLAPAPRAIVANLPYNVGTPLLINWLKQIDEYRSLTLMFQSEVVDRITASPKSKAYGRLSVITQFCCDAKRVLSVPAKAFTPPPKIASAVVHLTPRKKRPKDVSFSSIETITAAAFGQRRKMLRSSLKALGGEELLTRAKINPTRRAEELSLAEFENLARCWETAQRA
ncbi:MAG: 16S rRNA (adenine(1518)-N(6)/adenine(1519)-N(6))-dimethyltransferase RsmA [Alphaproteobacteria bacterium]|nr:16S rRNA (adenine(1518)-N(6)/adenine(1519)-N(6))-dimethyltransferase RsmA [Alphaproteobacteria bacterium]